MHKRGSHLNSFSIPRTLFLLGLLSLSSIAFSQTLQYTTLQVSPHQYTAAYGVNNLGDIVGTYSPDGFGSGFLYSKGNLQTTLNCSGGDNTYGAGINDNGVIVGGCATPAKGIGVIYQNGAYTYVTYPNAKVTSLAGINNNGEIVGTAYLTSGAKVIQRAFVYVNGVFTVLPSSVQAAVGINNHGTIAGISCNSSRVCSGVVVTKGAKGWHVQRKIVYPGAANTYLNGINDNGDLAGDWTTGPNVPEQAFVYLKSSNKFVSLNFNNNGNLAIASGINNSGEIVGEYSPTNGGAINGFFGTIQ
jgi:probable HAF family extracellular repeat protein